VNANLQTTGLGTDVEVYTNRNDVDLRWLVAWIKDKEATLSRFETTSELSRLNAQAGVWVSVSPLLWNLVEIGVAVARATDGLITPTVLHALVSQGYHRSFERGLDDGCIELDAQCVPSMARVELDVSRRAVRLPFGLGLDFGGLAKGYLADRLADELGTPALVDFGGDIAVRGPNGDGTAWVIETEPDARGVPWTLLLESGGIATSGVERRRWTRAGKAYHHIIDPRTGRSAKSDLLRATVIAPTAAIAEGVAKLAVLVGLRSAIDFIDAREGLAALLVDETGREWATSRFDEFVWRDNDQLA
jgi:thiamine biosynthesis lipoprotein